MWLWLGAIIAALGGLIALWPMPPAASRRRRPAGLRPRAAAPPDPSPSEPIREPELV
jgi:hypothetical protein